MQTVTVTTGARLHFGPLSYRPPAGRHFGGVGLMIQNPRVQLTVTEAAEDSVTGDPSSTDRVWEFVKKIRQSTANDRQAAPVRIDVAHALPSHSGLGSGTQLGMAIARAMAELAGEETLAPSTLAARVGRGQRSAVGVYGFASGGLIVDAGKHFDDRLGALCCRLPFPPEWRILLMTPKREVPGLSGTIEEGAFQQLGSMSNTLTDQLCRLVVMELLPAVQSADFEAYCDAVTEYGSRVGQFFAPVQGGTFGDATTDQLVQRLIQMGVRGIGQTSWGPTLFAFVPSAEQGEELSRRIESERRAGLPISRLQIVCPMNAGASIAHAP